uniref:EF-hand domain-containing protein n=1 Tax=Latimeria chalumnae TaxID=7897 RepID=H3A562_LATCH
MPTDLELAMQTLIATFHKYSGKEGDRYKLSKRELKDLFRSELPCFLNVQKDADAVGKIMKDLDSNDDEEVDFHEFAALVTSLTMLCNDFFEEALKKQGKC